MGNQKEKSKKLSNKEIKEVWDKSAQVIDSMIFTKRRYLTKELLRKIIVFDSIYNDEMVGEDLLKENGAEWLENIDKGSITDYNPEYLDDLLQKLQEDGGNDIIHVNPDWIIKVLLTDAKLYEDPKHWPDY